MSNNEPESSCFLAVDLTKHSNTTFFLALLSLRELLIGHGERHYDPITDSPGVVIEIKSGLNTSVQSLTMCGPSTTLLALSHQNLYTQVQ